MAELQRIRWYNPELESFEWREVPQSDEEALWLLSSSSYRPTSIDTYWYWRRLGASFPAALKRAVEVETEEERS